jgi:hypothetical protein
MIKIDLWLDFVGAALCGCLIWEPAEGLPYFSALKIPPCLPLPASRRRKTPKGGDVSFPLCVFFLPEAGKRGIEGDFMVILLISLAFEIHFSKG